MKTLLNEKRRNGKEAAAMSEVDVLITELRLEMMASQALHEMRRRALVALAVGLVGVIGLAMMIRKK